MKTNKAVLLFLLLFLFNTTYNISEAGDFKIAIMQDQKDVLEKYKPLLPYMKKNGINVIFVETLTYPAAASMFAAGETDAMFSGSGVAAIMLMKNFAAPLVRPLNKDGISTYSAVLLSKKGSPQFNESPDYFKGKKVVFCALASSGEIYYHSLKNTASSTTLIKASTHSGAIDALSRGFADVAIVKNRVWDKAKTKYPDLIVVGEDKEENPDNTLIVSVKANEQTILKVKNALLSLKGDNSREAQAVRDSLNIQGFIITTKNDFKHTLSLLKKAGVDNSFNFAFK